MDERRLTVTPNGTEIVHLPGRCSGHPTVGDTRLCVHDVVSYARLMGGDLRHVQAEAYDHMTLTALEGAMEYYEAHREEIDGILEERARFNAELRAKQEARGWRWEL